MQGRSPRVSPDVDWRQSSEPKASEWQDGPYDQGMADLPTVCRQALSDLGFETEQVDAFMKGINESGGIDSFTSDELMSTVEKLGDLMHSDVWNAVQRVQVSKILEDCRLQGARDILSKHEDWVTLNLDAPTGATETGGIEPDDVIDMTNVRRVQSAAGHSVLSHLLQRVNRTGGAVRFVPVSTGNQIHIQRNPYAFHADHHHNHPRVQVIDRRAESTKPKIVFSDEPAYDEGDDEEEFSVTVTDPDDKGKEEASDNESEDEARQITRRLVQRATQGRRAGRAGNTGIVINEPGNQKAKKLELPKISVFEDPYMDFEKITHSAEEVTKLIVQAASQKAAGVRFCHRFIFSLETPQACSLRWFDLVRCFRIEAAEFPVQLEFTLGMWIKTIYVQQPGWVNFATDVLPHNEDLLPLRIRVLCGVPVKYIDVVGVALDIDKRVSFADSLQKDVFNPIFYGFRKNITYE